MKTFSKLKMAQVFAVDRLTIYAWISRGCPCGPPVRPGGPSQMSFQDTLKWRLADAAKDSYYTEDGLRLIETQARAIRKELSKCK